MRPVIGIEVDIEAAPGHGRLFSKCYSTYVQRIWAAGGMPRLLAPVPEAEYIELLAAELDGLVIPGGDDIPQQHLDQPLYDEVDYVFVKEERYLFGRRIVEAMLARKLPIFGICYGAQLLNHVLGGRTIQDIPGQRPEADCHRSREPGVDFCHSISLQPGTWLHAALGDQVQVNSLHHQAIESPGTGLRVSARAPDGVIEAVESEPGQPLLIGAQWHPERPSCGPSGPQIFASFIEACRNRD